MNRDETSALFQQTGWVSYGKREIFLGGMLPDLMTVESTSVCNLRCVFCPYDEMTRKKGHMSLAEFERFLSAQCGHVSSLGLHHFGEPFLNPELPGFVEVCAVRGVRTTVSSNMTRTNEEIARAVLQAGLSRLIISIDAVRPETYAGLRVRGDFLDVVANTRMFGRLKTDLGADCFVEVQFIVTPENSHERENFSQIWQGTPGINQVTIRDERTHAGQRVRHGSYVVRSGTRQPCRYLWESVVILRNGDVVPCCKDFDGKMVLGNVFEKDTLASIWNGERMTALRQAHVHQQWESLPLCKSCAEWPGHSPMDEEESRAAWLSFKSAKTVAKSLPLKVRDYE